VFIADVGFQLGGRSSVRYLVLQIHYKFASSGLNDYTTAMTRSHIQLNVQLYCWESARCVV